MVARLYTHRYAKIVILWFLFWTSLVAAAAVSTTIGGPEPGCEAVLESQPISALVAQIFEGKLDKPVAYRIQVRVGQNDKFDYSQFRGAQHRFGVEVDVLDISTFRNNPIIEFLLKGNGRNVIQALMDLPKFSAGPYWLTTERPRGTEVSVIKKIPVVPMHRWYGSPQNRDLLIAQAVRSEISKPVIVLTNFGQPAFVVYQLKYFSSESPIKLQSDLAVVTENFRSEPFNGERIEGEIRGYQQGDRTDVVNATQMGGHGGPELLNRLASERRAVILVPKDDKKLEPSAQRRLLLFPL